MKDYQSELRRFISGQHLNAGVLVTAAVIVPAWILYHQGLLTSMIGFPLGALFVGMTDNPGPMHHRRNGMLICSLVIFMVALIGGLSRGYPLLVGAEIIILSIASAIISVFGTRAGSIGLTALIIFFLSTSNAIGDATVLESSFYYLLGGLWYLLVGLSITTLRPFRIIQQLMGECLIKISAFLSVKARFYDPEADRQQVLVELIDQQVEIHKYQEQLRSILFTTRRFVAESTHRGRVLTMMFRDSIDLFERAVSTHHEYTELHNQFADTDVLRIFQKNIHSMALILYNIGVAVQEGSAYRNADSLTTAIAESKEAFEKVRKEKLSAGNIESFIKLRHVFNSLQDLSERIKKLQLYTTYEKSLSGDYKSDVDLSKFATRQKINFNLLTSNISLKSSVFRHALRLTTALVAGYIVALLLVSEHSNWILLTIATIIKPAYSLSKQRNFQRLAGTFAGVGAGFLILLLSHNNTVIFVFMIIAMVFAYSLIKINYAAGIAGITLYLILSFHFLYPQGMNSLLADRILDTVIGCVIAYLVSYFVLPNWEYQQIDKLMEKSLAGLRKYFFTVAGAFTGNPPSTLSYKIARKEAFVSLANLSDTFQRMLSDPKSHQPDLPLYQQFVAAVHFLASHIASLSDYAQRFGSQYQHADFQPLVNLVDNTFEGNKQNDADLQATPVYRRVQRLLDQRKKDLESVGIEGTPAETRKTLSELVRITDQFRLIYFTAKETVKIAGDIKERRY